MEVTTKVKPEVGDKVKVSDGYRRVIGADGVVVKVTRAWVTVEVDAGVQRRYRLDTQMIEGYKAGKSNSTYTPRFHTLDQWARMEAFDTALSYLRDQGIQLDLARGAWRGREVELADVLRSHEAAAS